MPLTPLFELLGSAALGTALAWLALRRLPGRLPTPRSVLVGTVTGAVAGALITRFAFGPGHGGPLFTLLGAAFVGAVAVALFLRPSHRPSRAPRQAPFSLPSGG
ncbi:hypothetical protein ACN20G_07445 [Streptomyces sp. BI20]|uniref:hypothetical protein n=1 Tax=Streptomyces sp. BI20 TaxID=3403460 RepID=UPI003C789982